MLPSSDKMVDAHTLAAPAAPASCVDRARLYPQLDRWRELRALIVRAPAGYGKSVLVSRWIARAGEQLQAAWASLDKRIDAPDLFVRYIAAALDPLVAGLYDAIQPIIAGAHPDPERALGQLLLAVGAHRSAAPGPDADQLLLVLDDLHLLTSPEVLALLRRMIERGPPNLHLILIGREAPDLPLARLYASEQIAEITVEDLRFSPEELRGYLSLRGFQNISDADLAEIARRSAGWIAALQIVMLGLRTPDDLDGLIANLSADSRWLSAYMAEEVLAQLPAPVQRLLITSSILGSFNAPLCAAVSGLPDAQQLLDQIGRADLFLIGLDERGEWFRYHHLFQEWLQRRLIDAEGLPGVRDLHRRAAAWYAQSDEVAAAIQHLLAAGDDADAVELVIARLPKLILRDPYRARSWLDRLPPAQQATHPALLMLRCRLEGLLDNHELLTYVERAERVINVTNPAVPHADVYHAELLVWRAIAHFLRGDLAATADSLQRSRACPVMLDTFITGARDFITMHWYTYEGRYVEAAYHAEQALAAFAHEGYPAAEIAVRRELAKHAQRRGESVEANRQMHMITSSRHDGPFVLRELILAYVFAIQNSYWQNDLPQARLYYQQCELLARRLQDGQLLSAMAAMEVLYTTDPASSAAPYRAPVMVDKLRLRVNLQIALLLRAQCFEEAWHLASDLGVALDSDPATKTHGALIPFLQVYVARGVNLAALNPLLKRALIQRGQIGDRFGELWLLTLRAWQQLKLGRRREALAVLDQAARLARETGYIQVIREIPDLLPLLDQGDDAPEPTAGVLTAQERAVLRLLAQDYRYGRIAQELTISINTVQTHIRNLYTKLGVSRRAKAVERARELGLL